MTEYPRDWVASRNGEPASDLDLVILLLNSFDLLASPPDRLEDLAWFSAVLTDAGRPEIAAAFTPPDVAELRELRQVLRTVFEAGSAADAAAILNPVLVREQAIPQLVSADQHLSLEVNPAEHGMRALAARLPAALAGHLAQNGAGRLGICGSSPCRCAFIDRTRARTRRYCCVECNDRAAARRYRQRQAAR
ncbi:MAG: ABATE domain-containing protein [Streptosporangiaceae bacterium]